MCYIPYLGFDTLAEIHNFFDEEKTYDYIHETANSIVSCKQHLIENTLIFISFVRNAERYTAQELNSYNLIGVKLSVLSRLIQLSDIIPAFRHISECISELEQLGTLSPAVNKYGELIYKFTYNDGIDCISVCDRGIITHCRNRFNRFIYDLLPAY